MEILPWGSILIAQFGPHFREREKERGGEKERERASSVKERERVEGERETDRQTGRERIGRDSIF